MVSPLSNSFHSFLPADPADTASQVLGRVLIQSHLLKMMDQNDNKNLKTKSVCSVALKSKLIAEFLQQLARTSKHQ